MFLKEFFENVNFENNVSNGKLQNLQRVKAIFFVIFNDEQEKESIIRVR